MEKNYCIGVDYELYTVSADGTKQLEEKTNEGQPFRFLSGFGTTLEQFESVVAPLGEGETFDFTLTPEQAYGPHVEERVLMLDREMFCINGVFDSKNIYVDAIVPLQNEDGNRFFGHVLEVTDTQVRMDLNHPLAGKSLNFKGKVVERREATPKEIEAMLAHLAGETGGCGGNCGGCGGNCSGGCGGNCGDNCGDNCGCK